MSVRSGDICDQNLKLSKIATNLDVFALPNYRGARPPNPVPKLSCLPDITSSGRVSLRYSPYTRSYKRAYVDFLANF